MVEALPMNLNQETVSSHEARYEFAKLASRFLLRNFVPQRRQVATIKELKTHRVREKTQKE